MFRENTQYIYYYTPNGGGDDIGTSFMPYAGKWINIILVNSSAGKKLYINGQLVTSGTGSSTPRGNYTASFEYNQMLLTGRTSLSYGQSLEGNAREIILEDKTWTTQEVVDYYTRIKGKLGI